MDLKMKCFLLDDEISSLKYLKLLASQIPELEIVKAFNHPAKLLTAIQFQKVDLCIIDIHMPDINGIELAQKLHDTPIIFVTAFREFAAEAFDLHAIDYVRKPLTLKRLKEAVEKAKIYVSAANKTILQFVTENGNQLINNTDIAYIQNAENDRRDKILLLKDNTSIKLKNISFDEIKEKTGTQNLIRISKSKLIDLSTIKNYTQSSVTLFLDNAIEITFPLSPVYKEELIQAISKL